MNFQEATYIVYCMIIWVTRSTSNPDWVYMSNITINFYMHNKSYVA